MEDPFLFGAISAFHATSDVEAMGGRPVTALALVQIPYAMEEKQEEDLVQLMAGAATALKSLGCALAGGHTCESREMGLGFSVTGLLDGNVMTKSSMKPGLKHLKRLSKRLRLWLQETCWFLQSPWEQELFLRPTCEPRPVFSRVNVSERPAVAGWAPLLKAWPPQTVMLLRSSTATCRHT